MAHVIVLSTLELFTCLFNEIHKVCVVTFKARIDKVVSNEPNEQSYDAHHLLFS
jgi:hypothetical protein